MRSVRAGEAVSNTPKSFSCMGFSFADILVSSRITLRLPVFTVFCSFVIRRKFSLSRADSESSIARSNGPTSLACSRAFLAKFPIAKYLGRGPPDLWPPAAVFDGWKSFRSVRSQSFKIIWDDTCKLDGNVNTVAGALTMSRQPVGPFVVFPNVEAIPSAFACSDLSKPWVKTATRS